MAKLTAKQESFIQLMTKSEEHAQRGFELLLGRPGFEAYFDVLAEAGLFDPSKNPAPAPASEPGYFRIPYWAALTYLEAVAKLAGESGDLALAEKVMAVVRHVSRFRDVDGSARDNYHTHRKFAEILGLLPTSSVTLNDVDLIPVWLDGKFERGMVGHALGKGAIPRFLASDSYNDWHKALQITEHCTVVRRGQDEESGGKRRRAATLVEDHWLKGLIARNAKELGRRVGEGAAQIFVCRLREVFGEGERDPSWLRRPAVEDHAQNYSWHGPENRFVEGLRDVLLSCVDHDVAQATPLVEALLHDQAEIVRRVAIHVLGQRWTLLHRIYLGVVNPGLFDSGHLHELYQLLAERFPEFTEPEKAATLEAIRQLPAPTKGEDPTRRLGRVQRNWLSAVAGKGYEPADTWFKELSSDKELGGISDHPSFHAYMESWSGPGPSLYSVQELIAFAEDGNIVDKLNGFEPSGSWRAPTTRALVDALEEAVLHQPEVFLGLFPAFLEAKRPFQYGLIVGFKRVWDEQKEEQTPLDWGRAWSELVSFFEHLILDAGFWAEQIVADQSLTPNRDWIPPMVAEFLRAGTRDDEKAYQPDLLRKTWPLIETLLDRCDAVENANEANAMTQAINSSKGKAVETLFSHALRVCRISDRASGSHAEAWAFLRPVLDKELAKCQNANYEFSTLAGAYIANLEYLSHDWLRARIARIFPQDFPTNCACALNGLAYAPATRGVYGLLIESGVMDRALRQELKGQHTRENIIQRIALGYLWGDEDLDSARFSYLFDSGQIEDLKEVSRFFWSGSDQEVSEDRVARILDYWTRCVNWSRTAPQRPAELLSALSRLISYVRTVGEKEMNLLLAVAPFVHVDYNADEFIEGLERLADEYPAEVSGVLGQVLATYSPPFDFEDRLKTLLKKLAARGRRSDAIAYAEQLRHLPGMLGLFTELTGRP